MATQRAFFKSSSSTTEEYVLSPASFLEVDALTAPATTSFNIRNVGPSADCVVCADSALFYRILVAYQLI